MRSNSDTPSDAEIAQQIQHYSISLDSAVAPITAAEAREGLRANNIATLVPVKPPTKRPWAVIIMAAAVITAVVAAIAVREGGNPQPVAVTFAGSTLATHPAPSTSTNAPQTARVQYRLSGYGAEAFGSNVGLAVVTNSNQIAQLLSPLSDVTKLLLARPHFENEIAILLPVPSCSGRPHPSVERVAATVTIRTDTPKATRCMGVVLLYAVVIKRSALAPGLNKIMWHRAAYGLGAVESTIQTTIDLTDPNAYAVATVGPVRCIIPIALGADISAISLGTGRHVSVRLAPAQTPDPSPPFFVASGSAPFASPGATTLWGRDGSDGPPLPAGSAAFNTLAALRPGDPVSISQSVGCTLIWQVVRVFIHPPSQHQPATIDKANDLITQLDPSLTTGGRPHLFLVTFRGAGDATNGLVQPSHGTPLSGLVVIEAELIQTLPEG